jgi:hypothetical protein
MSDEQMAELKKSVDGQVKVSAAANLLSCNQAVFTILHEMLHILI